MGIQLITCFIILILSGPEIQGNDDIRRLNNKKTIKQYTIY